MLYHINGWFPRQCMSGHGFSIKLYSGWKKAVAESGLTQAAVNEMINTEARQWLENLGYNLKGLLHPEWDFNIRWGEWGPEHITIPGSNATGLDLEDSYNENSRILVPHNVDSLQQASLLMTIFTRFSNMLVYKLELDAHKNGIIL